jgi:hypothetical protein
MSLYSAADVPDYELETDDDSGDGYFSMLDLSALQSGQYYVAVEAYEGFYGFEPIPGYHISILTDPSSPVGLSAFISGSGVHLQWSTPVSDGGFPIDHYQVWRALNGGTSVAYSDAPSTSFFDDGVIGGEGYVYSVIAVTEFGGSQPADAVQIQVPVGIGTPDVISQCWVDEADDSFSLTWPEPDPNGSAILAYHVYRGTMADGSDRHEIGQSTGPAFIDLTVEKGRTYYYWVAGENSNGMGAVSAPTVATAITTSGLGALPWVPILAAIVVVASAMVLVVIWAKRGRSRSRSGGELPQTMQPGPQIQMDQGRCPGCHAPTEGLPFCGNCGRRLL